MMGWRDKSVDDQDGPGSEFQLQSLLPALALAAIGLVALILASLSGPAGQGQYLVIAAPWSERADMLDMVWRAGGGISGFGGLSAIAIAMGDRPDFAASLRAQGAWLVLPAPRVLGCFTPQDEGAE